jgi:hypothetical protein
MNEFINAKNAYNPNLEVFRTNSDVRMLIEQQKAIILKNVALFELTDSEKIFFPTEEALWKRVSVMPQHEREMDSFENTFFKNGSPKFSTDKIIHFVYVRNGSVTGVESAVEDDGFNLRLVNICFEENTQICRLGYNGNIPFIAQTNIQDISVDGIGGTAGVGDPDDEITTESITKKGILKKHTV